MLYSYVATEKDHTVSKGKQTDGDEEAALVGIGELRRS